MLTPKNTKENVAYAVVFTTKYMNRKKQILSRRLHGRGGELETAAVLMRAESPEPITETPEPSGNPLSGVAFDSPSLGIEMLLKFT